ncbi:MAG: hypothetical protein QNI86_10950 [Halieaceae bacterium]|nr:hypothetical protein [Halieaceae bacterium]
MSISVPTLRGGSRLVFDAVEGLTTRVERMHEAIAAPPLPGLWGRPGAHGLIASSVYASIRGVNGLLRDIVDSGYGLVPHSIDDAGSRGAEIRAVSALNGAIGDYLEAEGNPLALPMTLRHDGRELVLDAPDMPRSLASPRLVVFMHGLGLSELSWQSPAAGIGNAMEEELGLCPLYLRYNTGRHISTNGQQLAELLNELCSRWPVPVESLSLVGHSMGGLVIRSACWYAEQAKMAWVSDLQRVVCLGSPHHGAPLEKAGHALDLALQRIPYAEPLLFGKQRSAGIKDLRHGNLLDEDWLGRDPDAPLPDNRVPVPLLPGVDYFFAAAAVGESRRDVSSTILGDLLVRLDSASGVHKDTLRSLNIDPERFRVFFRKHHFDLLSDLQVMQQLLDWLGDR